MTGLSVRTQRILAWALVLLVLAVLLVGIR